MQDDAILMTKVSGSVHTSIGRGYERNSVNGGYGADVMGSGNRAGDRSFLGAILDALAGKVGSTTLHLISATAGDAKRLDKREGVYLGGLEDDGRLLVAGGLEDGNGGGARGDLYGVIGAIGQAGHGYNHVGGGDGKSLLPSVGEELEDVVACGQGLAPDLGRGWIASQRSHRR